MRPRRGLFELGGDADEHVLAAHVGDELHADGETVARQCSGREIAG